MHAIIAEPELSQNVNLQQETPSQTPAPDACLADTNAYVYEKRGVPIKGA
jgi:hypothetical protein